MLRLASIISKIAVPKINWEWRTLQARNSNREATEAGSAAFKGGNGQHRAWRGYHLEAKVQGLIPTIAKNSNLFQCQGLE